MPYYRRSLGRSVALPTYQLLGNGGLSTPHFLSHVSNSRSGWFLLIPTGASIVNASLCNSLYNPLYRTNHAQKKNGRHNCDTVPVLSIVLIVKI